MCVSPDNAERALEKFPFVKRVNRANLLSIRLGIGYRRLARYRLQPPVAGYLPWVNIGECLACNRTVNET